MVLKKFLSILFLSIPLMGWAQEISLFRQFNGPYDYVAFGNTLNPAENGATSECSIFTESSADFQLEDDQTVRAAYLYWAGSGTGDFEVALNGISITSQRNFSYIFTATSGNIYEYFAAFADVTDLVSSSGNGTYTLSELDLTEVIPAYCNPPGNSTNFGGWAINVIYEDASLPLNQVNIFDGLEAVSATNTSLTIELNNLNVLDNTGAKIGFLAWEGDSTLANNETLRVNGNTISNPPLNPADNAFNSTNSFTNSSELYNMDIDFYNIENNISPGDSSATITLTSDQDLVMINNIVTVLNSELPDATIEIDETNVPDECGNREIEIAYTVYNLNSTDILPANTPVAFYANTTLIGQSQTTSALPIDGSESGTITLVIPETIPAAFTLRAVADDTGNGTGTIDESNEGNNDTMIDITLTVFPVITALNSLTECDVEGVEVFDLTLAITTTEATDSISFYLSEENAMNDEAPIDTPEAFENTTNPQTIYVRVANTACFSIDSFDIEVITCPLPDGIITIDSNLNACRRRDLTIEYTVKNIGTAPLPAATSIAFYANTALIAQSQTQSTIAAGGTESGVETAELPEEIANNFTVTLVIDDDGSGNGQVIELIESNNSFDLPVSFNSIPPISMLPDLLLCDVGGNTAIFDLTEQTPLITTSNTDSVTFYRRLEDALSNTNAIVNTESYQNITDPQTIYVRLENEICFTTTSFLLTTENCAPFVPQGFSPNGDRINDLFEISGLLNVFDAFELFIYTREGNLIHTASNQDGFWNGIATQGLLFTGNVVPVGTYYYVLLLNDRAFPAPLTGFVYINY